MSPLLGGASSTYWLNLRSYNEMATARAFPNRCSSSKATATTRSPSPSTSPVTPRARRRPNVTVHRYPQADHAFIDGAGPPTPADFDIAGHVDPSSSPTSSWVHGIP